MASCQRRLFCVSQLHFTCSYCCSFLLSLKRSLRPCGVVPAVPFSSYRSNKPAPRNSLCARHFETAAPHWTPSALARAFFEAAPKMEPTQTNSQETTHQSRRGAELARHLVVVVALARARHLRYRAGRMPAPLSCSWRPPYSRRPTSGLPP